MTGPLDRRRAALARTLDEDDGFTLTPSQRAAFVDRAQRLEARRDRQLREEGAALLAEYAGDGTMADALRSYVRDLLPDWRRDRAASAARQPQDRPETPR